MQWSSADRRVYLVNVRLPIRPAVDLPCPLFEVEPPVLMLQMLKQSCLLHAQRILLTPGSRTEYICRNVPPTFTEEKKTQITTIIQKSTVKPCWLHLLPCSKGLLYGDLSTSNGWKDVWPRVTGEYNIQESCSECSVLLRKKVIPRPCAKTIRESCPLHQIAPFAKAEGSFKSQ